MSGPWEAFQKRGPWDAYRKKAQPEQPQEEDPGMLRTLAIQAGGSLDRLAAGAKDLTRRTLGDKAVAAVDRLGAAMGMGPAPDLEARQSANKPALDRLAEKRPVESFIGSTLPYLGFGAGVASPAGAVAAAALPGLIEYGTPEERLLRGAAGAAGGAAGVGLGKGIARVLQPTRPSAAAVAPDVLAAAERVGYRVPAGQQTGSKALQMLEQQAAKNPFASGVAQRFNEGNQQAINRAAARAIGEESADLGEDVMRSASERLGAKFNELVAGKEIPLTERFGQATSLLQNRATRGGPFADTQVLGLAEKAAEVAKRGSITGEEYQGMREALSAIKRSAAAGNNGPLKGAANSVIKALDDAAESALPADVVKEWTKTRAQYAAMKTLEKRGAIKGGNVDPAIVRNALQSGDRAAYARGKIPGELADIARIGNAFRPLPDSGTAGNLTTQALLSGGAGLLGLPALATTVVAPQAIARGVFSDAGRKYLTKGLGLSEEAEKQLLERLAVAGGLLGLQASQ